MNNSAYIKWVAQNITRKRCIKCVTQMEIAIAMQVSIGTVSRWESRNFSQIKTDDLIKLLNYLGSRGVMFTYAEYLTAEK